MTVIGHLSSTLGLTLSNTTFNLTLHHSALFTLSLSSQWPEWMADVPLLCYITIALEDKEYLEVEDFLIIFGFFGMIAFGYVMNLTTGYHPTPPFTSVRFISISISISINPINQVVHLKYQRTLNPIHLFPILTHILMLTFFLFADIPTAIFFLILSSACIASSYYLAQDASREIEVKTQVQTTSSHVTSR